MKKETFEKEFKNYVKRLEEIFEKECNKLTYEDWLQKFGYFR